MDDDIGVSFVPFNIKKKVYVSSLSLANMKIK
jgi:hypothetical protein